MQATVRDAMSTDVVVTPLHTRISDAERLMLDHGVEELFVVDSEGLLCGVVPDYELLKWRLNPGSEQQRVDMVMSRRFLVIGVDSSLIVAARYLREHIHRRLAVVEERRLIGQITRQAVLTWLKASDMHAQFFGAEDNSRDHRKRPSTEAEAATSPRTPSTRPTSSVLTSNLATAANQAR